MSTADHARRRIPHCDDADRAEQRNTCTIEGEARQLPENHAQINQTEHGKDRGLHRSHSYSLGLARASALACARDVRVPAISAAPRHAG